MGRGVRFLEMWEEDTNSLLHGSDLVCFHRQIVKTISDLSLCLSYEDRISLLSLLIKQKSRLSRVTMWLGRNMVV